MYVLNLSEFRLGQREREMLTKKHTFSTTTVYAHAYTTHKTGEGEEERQVHAQYVQM